MATAPKPVSSRPGAQVFRITLQSRTLEMPTSITLQEKMALRFATGLPFEAFWSGAARIGEDSLSVLWWLARRANGEPNLPWAQHAAEWPSDLGADDVEIALIDLDETQDSEHPESSGPA